MMFVLNGYETNVMNYEDIMLTTTARKPIL